MKNKLTIQAKAQVKAASDDSAAPSLEILAYTGEPLSLWGFVDPVVIDIAGVQASENIPIVLDHNTDVESIVGQTIAASIGPNDIRLQAQVLGTSPKVQRFLELASKGLQWQASVGMDILESERIPSDATVQANGREYKGPLLLVRAGILREVSVTLLGADPNTQTTLAKREPIMADQVNQNLQPAGEPQITQPSDLQAQALEQIRAQASAELERIAAVRKIAADHPEIAAQAVREGWDSMRTELEVLRASRAAPAIHTPANDATPAAIEAALCLSAGIPEKMLVEDYGPKTLEAARKHYRRAGLHALIYETIRAAGKYARPGIMDSDTIRTAFEADRELRAAAAFSTVSLSSVMENVANRALLAAYQAVATAAPLIALESDVRDFKQAVRYRLTGLDTFDRVAPTGELKHAAVADKTFTNQADTYGVVITIDRRMIINDDLGAFLQLPQQIGRRAAVQREKAVFELLLANPDNFFSTANKNLVTGAEYVLSIAGLTKAEQTMLDQTDDNGVPILITPAILLVPSTLKVTAQQLMTETRVNETTPQGKPAPANNPHAGKWQPVASSFLNAQGLPGSSAKAWYLLANPQDVAAIEIVYVQGRRVPVIESGEPDFNTLGLAFRAYWDFGVALQDPKAAVKVTGVA